MLSYDCFTNIFHHLFRNQILSGSFWVLLSSVLVNLLNYFFHLITSRFLLPQNYGLLESYVSVFAVISVFITAFGLALTNIYSRISDVQIPHYLAYFRRLAINLSLILFFALLLSYPLINFVLKSNSFATYFVFLLIPILSLLAIVYQPLLQSRLKFFEFSLLNVAQTLVKNILVFVLFFMGITNTAVGLTGYIAPALVTIIYVKLLVKKYWPNRISTPHLPNLLSSSFVKFSVLSLFATLVLTLGINLDLILVRYYFDPVTSGIYSATTILGKTILYGSGAILLVTYPLFLKFKDNPDRLLRLFWVSFIFIFFTSAAGTLGFSFYPRFFTSLLFNNSYSDITLYIPAYAVFISLYSLFYLFIQYFLSLEKYIILPLGLLSVVTQVVLIYFYHRTLSDIILSSAISLIIPIIIGIYEITLRQRLHSYLQRRFHHPAHS